MVKDAHVQFVVNPNKNKMDKNIIAVDFDGTCVTHEFPKIGKNIGAAEVLIALSNKGYKLILYTMRSGLLLQEAVEWFKNNNIPLYAINENPSQKSWTNSPKVFAHYYIDDAAVGCPLLYDEILSNRPYVDWEEIENYFM